MTQDPDQGPAKTEQGTAPVLKALDLPPVWLLGFCLLAWAQVRLIPMDLSLEGPVTGFLSGLLIGAGLVLMALAFAEFRRHQTTIVPHRSASHLIQSGIFTRTRNPIYLGDVLVLTGVILWMDAVLSLTLVPIFVWILEKRFVIPEENRMRREFRADFGRYENKVRRWV